MTTGKRIAMGSGAVGLSAIALVSLTGWGAPLPVAAPQATPEVGVVAVEAKPRRIVRELPGRISPTRVADVRARVSGIVVERLFVQGSDVVEGQPLYRIDPKPFEVEVQASEAALEKAKAAYDQAALQARRVETLLTTNAASRSQHETATANWRKARADVQAAEADVARAKLNLDYATIRAPISGRIGAALVTEGALVGQGEATRVATIQQINRVYVDFTQSVAEMNRLRREVDSGALERVGADAVHAEIRLDDEEIHPLTGRLLFSDATVDPSTGQVMLRAEFRNPHLALLPGMYVRIRIGVAVDTDSIAVPQQAVQRNSDGSSGVFVLRPDNRVELRPVRVGDALESEWLVLDGLKSSERIVVDGFQKFIPGDVVKPAPWGTSPLIEASIGETTESLANTRTSAGSIRTIPASATR